MSDEKKLATMICCVCRKEIDKNYAINTVGNYCKRCAFDRALKIQIEKDYESGAMDENIIFDVEEALKNNQDAGAYVGDLLRIIHRLQNENETLKTELRKECEEHEEFTKKAKAEIERLTEENNELKIDVGRFLKKAVFYYRTCQSYGIENFYDEDLEPKGKEVEKITFPQFKDVEVK